MRRAPIAALLGPASVLYLIAEVASAQGTLDPRGMAIAAVAFGLSLFRFLVPRQDEVGSADRVAWLSLALSCVLVRAVAPAALSLPVDLCRALGLAAAAALLVDLALTTPDRVAGFARTRFVRSCVWAAALAAALAAISAQAPPFEILGRAFIVAPIHASWPDALWLGALALSLTLRALRRRLGSGPEALASNAWALMGTAPAFVLWLVGALAPFVFALSPQSSLVRAPIVVAAALLCWAHLKLIDPKERLRVGPMARDAVAALVTLGAVAAIAATLGDRLPRTPLPLAVFATATLLLSLGIYRALRPISQRFLSPFGGRLLGALARAPQRLSGVSSFADLGAAVLGACREASGDVRAEPVLYVCNPALELRIDLAGQPRIAERGLGGALLTRLRERTGEIVLRDPLQAQIVRRPAWRPLIEHLSALDALCVLPLTEDSELEGALVLPRGLRRSALSLEELDALRRFGAHVTGFVSVLAAQERAARRAALSSRQWEHARAEVEATRAENARLLSQIKLVRSAGAAERLQDPVFAYSPTMRSLLRRSDAVSALDAPLFLVGEEGTPLAPLAQHIHGRSKRIDDPFVIADAAALPAERNGPELFDPNADDGWLALAAGGTLLIVDLPALGAQAQGALLGHLVGDGERAPAGAPRVIATAREGLPALVERGAVLEQLAERFAVTLDVPPLRERAEDLPSSILLAIDRACRRRGRAIVGIDNDARERLQGYRWPGNLAELESVIDLAVARCGSSRIAVADLPALPGLETGPPREHPLDGTLESLEHKVLSHALDRARGNKSEAARLLGLPRTTFLDKLRRHGLDDGSARSASN